MPLTSFTKPIWFLCRVKGFCVFMCLDNILGPTSSKCAGQEGTNTFWLSWFILDYILIFCSPNFISHITFFQGLFGIQLTCLCLWYLKNFMGYSSWLILCYWSKLLKSPTGYIFFGQDDLFCQWTRTTLLVVSCIQSDILNIYHSPTHFFSPLHSSTESALEIVTVAAESSAFMISSSLCIYCCRYYALSLGPLFSVVWVSYILQWNLVWFYAHGS